MRSLRCENRKSCLTAYRNVDFAATASNQITCPECGSPLMEPRRFTSGKQRVLFLLQVGLIGLATLSFIFLRSEAAELYEKLRGLFQ